MKRSKSKCRNTRPKRTRRIKPKSLQSTSTQELRIEAQIAMLRRALLAAEEKGLPHKAVCEYLQTLSQMAKWEPASVPTRRRTRSDIDDDAESQTVAGQMNAPKLSEKARKRLRRTIADIYGIADSPATDEPSQAKTDATSKSAERAGKPNSVPRARREKTE